MKIVLLVEGGTEKAFINHLRTFINRRLPPDQSPKLKAVCFNGEIERGAKLERAVRGQFANGADYVIGLTDVYPKFNSAAEAKALLTSEARDDRFRAHAAQYDFEAWLLPFWKTIQKRSKTNAQPFAANPETVNGTKPPSKRLRELYAKGGGYYSKTREVNEILSVKDNDLAVAAAACKELRLFLNTILELCGGQLIPEP